MKAQTKNVRICKGCGIEHDKKEVARIYGKESMPALLGFCSALCYTNSKFPKPSAQTFEQHMAEVMAKGINSILNSGTH